MKPKIDFKSQAKQHLTSAKEELSSNDERRLKYAALEIRMCMEAVTYERAQIYAEEISPEIYETWQPKKLMLFLLEIDPYADQTSTISMATEEKHNTQPNEMKILGTDHVLSLKEIKRNYDAIGQYLHIPTYKQLTETGQSLISLEKKCLEVIEILENVVNSKIYNSKFYLISEVECLRCQHPIKKNVINLKKMESMEVKCLGCDAAYFIKNSDFDQTVWTPKKSLFNCAQKDCNQENSVWTDELKLGAKISCSVCGSINEIALFNIIRNQENNKKT